MATVLPIPGWPECPCVSARSGVFALCLAIDGAARAGNYAVTALSYSSQATSTVAALSEQDQIRLVTIEHLQTGLAIGGHVDSEPLASQSVTVHVGHEPIIFNNKDSFHDLISKRQRFTCLNSVSIFV